MFLKKLEIKDMFGIFNYSLDFNDDMTIITAPNGYGKTICLKIIHSIFNLNFMYFAELDFDQISLTTDKGTLSIVKTAIVKKGRDVKQVSLFSQEEINSESSFFDEDIVLFDNKQNELEVPKKLEIVMQFDGVIKIHPINLEEHYELYRRHLDESHVFLSRMDYDRWTDRRPGLRRNYSFEEAIEAFGLPDLSEERFELPKWLVDFCKNQKTYFVQDQRLILKKNDKNSRNDFFTNAIERYSERLKSKIRDSSVKVSMNSQQLDSTFPKRLVTSKDKYDNFDKNELIEALEKIQDKRKKLMKYDLLSQDSSLDNEIEVDHIEENDVKVLNLYVLDTNKKLSSFDDIYEKINTFVEVLNRKLIFKKVKVNSRRGFYFVRLDNNMEACDDEEKLLSLSKLSSGEQHQVVLLYQLIFNTEPQTLVLIDEPEISLHVVWQKQFMEDLVEVSKINNIKSIIATHSPQIIGDKWNSTIDLADLREQEAINQ